MAEEDCVRRVVINCNWSWCCCMLCWTVVLNASKSRLSWLNSVLRSASNPESGRISGEGEDSGGDKSRERLRLSGPSFEFIVSKSESRRGLGRVEFGMAEFRGRNDDGDRADCVGYDTTRGARNRAFAFLDVVDVVVVGAVGAGTSVAASVAGACAVDVGNVIRLADAAGVWVCVATEATADVTAVDVDDDEDDDDKIGVRSRSRLCT